MNDTQPLITTARLELWRPRTGDLESLHAMMDDGETVRFVGNHVPSMADNFARLLRNAGSWALWGYGTFMVRFKGEERIVASVGLFRSFRGFGGQPEFDNAVEAGWIVHRDHWGQGIAKEAMEAGLAWFDQVHGKQRVVCMIEQGHAASDALAKRLGFAPYGEHQPETGAKLILYERG